MGIIHHPISRTRRCIGCRYCSVHTVLNGVDVEIPSSTRTCGRRKPIRRMLAAIRITVSQHTRRRTCDTVAVCRSSLYALPFVSVVACVRRTYVCYVRPRKVAIIADCADAMNVFATTLIVPHDLDRMMSLSSIALRVSRR